MVAVEISIESMVTILSSKLGGEMIDVHPFAGHTSHQMYTASWVQPSGTLPIMIRLFEGVRRRDQARIEAAALEGLARAGFPVPELYLLQDDDSLPDRPLLVMERLEGLPLGDLVHAHPELIPQWVEKAALLLVKLHTINYDQCFTNLQQEIEAWAFADRQIRWWSRQAETVGATNTEPGFNWLRANLYKSRKVSRVSVVHRDFHPNNILATPEQITGIVDWGEFTLADPAVDLGWTRMVLATEVDAELGDSVVAHYTKYNAAVLATLPFWEVFAACKRLTTLATQHQSTPNLVHADLEQRVEAFMHERLTDED